MTFLDLPVQPDRGFEHVERSPALLIERDENERRAGEPRDARVQQRGVALDQLAVLQRTHPAQAGGG